MPLVAGVDTSTQSCKIVVRDAQTGELVRTGSAKHPDGTEVDPNAWWKAFEAARDAAGGLDDVAALSVGGQQHGMVALDGDGSPVRDALLWNDTRSAQAASDLIEELGDGRDGSGERAWADAVGIVPVASFTITKLRWLAEQEPENAERVEAVALPHDWLTWRIAGDGPVATGTAGTGCHAWSPTARTPLGPGTSTARRTAIGSTCSSGVSGDASGCRPSSGRASRRAPDRTGS